LTQTTSEVQSDLDRVWPKASGSGIKVDLDAPTFPWVDLIGLIEPDLDHPSTSPERGVFQTGVNGYIYNTNDILDCKFHIPHDWLPGGDSLFHIHWGNSSALVENDTFTVTPTATYGSRDGVYGTPVTLDPITYTVGAGGLAQHSHIVTEVTLSVSGGSANDLDSDDIEVDGLVMVSLVVTSEAITGDFFIFTADIHHQSTGIGTKNNASPFYT